MKKLLQLIFGDWRNAGAVAVSAAAAYAAARAWPLAVVDARRSANRGVESMSMA